VTPDESGSVPFSLVFEAAVPEGAWVTATATDTVRGNTSEFCEAIITQEVELILSGSVSGGDLSLEWSPVAPAAAYWVFGAVNRPYFSPQMEPPFGHRVQVLSDTTWSVAAGIADPDTNWTYQVIAVDGSGHDLARSNRIGEHDFALPYVSPPASILPRP
jgi:hypothetical protein